MGEITPMYKNKIRLNKPRDIQKLLARTANMLMDDQISEGKARAVGYICQIMFKGFETIDLQGKIEELEEFKNQLEENHGEAI